MNKILWKKDWFTCFYMLIEILKSRRDAGQFGPRPTDVHCHHENPSLPSFLCYENWNCPAHLHIVLEVIIDCLLSRKAPTPTAPTSFWTSMGPQFNSPANSHPELNLKERLCNTNCDNKRSATTKQYKIPHKLTKLTQFQSPKVLIIHQLTLALHDTFLATDLFKLWAAMIVDCFLVIFGDRQDLCPCPPLTCLFAFIMHSALSIPRIFGK
jgi:hypothetical protein